MTKLSNPFFVKDPFSESEIFVVSASGVVSKNPVRIGTSTVPVVIEMPEVSASGRTTSAKTLPVGTNKIVDAIFITDTSASGMAGGISVRIGDAGTQNKFGNVVVSAENASYRFTLLSDAVSAGTELIVDATVQGSATNIDAFQGRTFITVMQEGS